MEAKSSLMARPTRRGALVFGLALAATFGIASAIFAPSLARAAEGKGKSGGGCSDCSGETESGHESGGMGRSGSKGKRSGRTGVEHDILHDSGHGGRSSGVKGKVLGGHDKGGESEDEGHK